MDERHDAFPAGLAATDELAAEATEEPLSEVIGEGPLEELEELEAEIEVVDGLPVVSTRREVARSAAALPAVQTAAAAATGFMVGAATLALLRRRDSRRLTRELRDLRGRLEPRRRPPEPPMEPGQSYLLHVRVFSRPGHDQRG
jgi:hypothetical protein